MVSSKVQGALGAQLALRILRGEPPDEIPVIRVEANHYMFDYPVIKRFGIPGTALPAESAVINQPEPFYHVEKTYLWIGVAMMAILMSTTLLLLKSLKMQKSAARMKNEFISTAAHELRTPLTAVLGYAELLVDDFIQTPLNLRQKQEFAEHILRKAECLEKITNDLLDVGRLETGRPIVLEKSRHDLAQLIWDTVRPFTVETTRHDFSVELPEENLFLDFDKSKLTQVLDNLISNAIKYSPQGGTVHIECQTNPEGEVTVSVADQGIGMTDEQLKKAFDKFYRADNSNTAVGGLGLGLGIAKGIIEAHGGRILVESQYGYGTRVTFSLPN